MDGTVLAIAVIAGVGWIGFALLATWVWRAPNTHRELPGRAAYRFGQVYARALHRVRVVGREHIPADGGTGWRGAGSPLIVIANHTSGCDPLLVQSALPFEARWIMAEDMRVPVLDPVWGFLEIITLDRRGGSARGLREAMGHLKRGGVLGLFPEGHLERPARQLLPFEPGVAMLIRRSGARVLPAIIDGTPQRLAAWDSLLTPSRSQVRFLPVIEPSRWEGMDAEAIAGELRSLYARETGWAMNDRKPLMRHDPPLLVDMAGNYVDEGGTVWREDGSGVLRATDDRAVRTGEAPEARAASGSAPRPAHEGGAA
ncbi:MAG: lysophospholipid acyltransferase family protein [Phycisphaerales bacterium]